jgi:5,10-methylenetetrahydromethanopterin reductase
MGYRAIPWSYMESYIRAYRGLLRGEVVEWEGAQMQMLHPEGHAPARPVEVPILIAALGPKGNKVASQLGDGLYVTLQLPSSCVGTRGCRTWPGARCSTRGKPWTPSTPVPPAVQAGPWPITVPTSSAVPTPYANFPGGAGWMDVVDKTPLERRHLAVHAGHCVALNEADQAA